MKLSHFISVAGLLVAGVQSASLLNAIQKLPECGKICLSSSMPSSSCSNILDSECICSDKQFRKVAEACIIKNCAVLEAIDIAKIQADACNWPVRDRRGDLKLPLIVEIPAMFCPFLRMYARWTTLGKLAVDDYLVFLAGVVYIAVVAIAQINGAVAFGVDIWTLEIKQMTDALMWFFVGESLYLFCLGLTKVSVIAFYLRIFPQRSFRYMAISCITFIVISTLTFMLVQIFQCRPIEFTWQGWTSPNRAEKCLDVNILAYAAAGSSILQDIIVLVLPLPFLFKLQTGWRVKLGIMFMFSLGIFVLVTSCVRLRYIVGFGETHNPSWDYTDPALWSGLEVAVSIIVVCLPAIRLLLDRLNPGWIMTVMTRSGTSKGSTSLGGTKSSRVDRSMRSEHRRGVYRSEGAPNDSEIELGPRLGDKIHGDVHTEIYRDPGSPLDPRGDGIQVTTVTRIETNGWQNGNRSLSLNSDELHPRQHDPR